MSDLLDTKCKLDRVELIAKDGKTRAILTLTGSELAITADMARLNLQENKEKIGFLFVEQGKDKKTLLVHAAVSADSNEPSVEAKIGNVVEAVHAMTQCQLGGLMLSASAMPIFPAHPQTPFAAAVTITPQVDRTDKSNLVGMYSMEVIRRAHAQGGDMIVDPRSEDASLRLLDVMTQFPKKQAALDKANKALKKLERTFDLYHKDNKHVVLANVHTEALNDDMRRKHDLTQDMLGGRKNQYVTTATLVGPETMLVQAEKELRGTFPDKIFRQVREGNLLRVMLCGDDHIDPARLVTLVHERTHCSLPMDLHASSAVTLDNPAEFNPVIETALWEDVPAKRRIEMGNAFVGYVGLQCPSQAVLRVDHAHENPLASHAARVVVSLRCDSPKEALEVAETMRERVMKTMRTPHTGRT